MMMVYTECLSGTGWQKPRIEPSGMQSELLDCDGLIMTNDEVRYVKLITRKKAIAEILTM